MKLISLLENLSRSSAYAVSTQGNSDLDAIKDYLYVETQVEKDFLSIVDQLRYQEITGRPGIIMLCGSSGDGKSELIRNHRQQLEPHFDLHVDATHAYSPDKSAIETLNDVIRKSRDRQRHLIIGINMGMLGNLAKEGDDDHRDIKRAIQRYLDCGEYQNELFRFVNFNDYPRLTVCNGALASPFIEEIFQRITAPKQDNPFYEAYLQDKNLTDLQPVHRRQLLNFELLCQSPVQKTLINLLGRATLDHQQFLTARVVLDFLHQIICVDGWLFDNLFTSADTPLFRALAEDDPANIRSNRLDQFILSHIIRHDDSARDVDFGEFRNAIKKKGFDFDGINQQITETSIGPVSWVRFFYLVQEDGLGQAFPLTFQEDFEDQAFREYLVNWNLHREYALAIQAGQRPEQKLRHELVNFYRKFLQNALLTYGNHLWPTQTAHGRLHHVRDSSLKLASKVSISPHSDRINQPEEYRQPGCFRAYFKVNDHLVTQEGIEIDLPFFRMLDRIGWGFRPNRHDKNAVLRVEELLEVLQDAARQGTQYLEISPGHLVSLEESDDMWLVTDVNS